MHCKERFSITNAIKKDPDNLRGCSVKIILSVVCAMTDSFVQNRAIDSLSKIGVCTEQTQTVQGMNFRYWLEKNLEPQTSLL